MKRLILLLFLLAVCSCSSKTDSKPVKVMTYKIHYWSPDYEGKGRPPQSFRDARDKAGGIVKLFAQEIKRHNPDIISLQEARDSKKVAALAKELGMNYAFFPGGWKNKGWPEGIPGAILTRFKIVESQDFPVKGYKKRPDNFFSRHLGRVLVDTGTEKIAVISAHVIPPYKGVFDIRMKEAATMVEIAKKDLAKGYSVIAMGDFNMRPDSKEYGVLKKSVLKDTFVLKGAGNKFTCPGTKPNETIDYVFAAGPLLKRLKSCKVLHEGIFVMGHNQKYALSDHLPVMAVFE